jgi:hypothetical protein
MFLYDVADIIAVHGVFPRCIDATALYLMVIKKQVLQYAIVPAQRSCLPFGRYGIIYSCFSLDGKLKLSVKYF